MTLDLREHALAWRERGIAAVVVSVGETRGSVPREAGTRMLVAAHAVAGTIGGGHLELQAITHARRLLAGENAPAEQHLALGPSLGQCCGGALTLHYQAMDHCDPALWPTSAPRFHLQLYGAGHVGRAIVEILAGVPCSVQWIDEREAEFPAAPSPPHVERLCVEPVEAEVGQAPPGSAFLVLTHSHDLDLRITEAILRRGDFGYLGLIGSATKRARFVKRFESRGLDVSRLVCPIGLPGIAGKEPAVIAVAVVAQLLLAA